ncbi:vacuolar import and degradation protein-domain-containing protein [Boeremia exigua]|uniref:vacuolar import and degradation protein-domain-containing protein n=1 Tax=Boeremia exigua TaxID=749465 RepID=UPI001E8CE6D1|nr:vacuolar import and degradation protein-domain-containing protein [Boeremia exigua]KAH6633184.1 vacuolar import and degradation protein-domain-containing protein [Boeremia exigua]
MLAVGRSALTTLAAPPCPRLCAWRLSGHTEATQRPRPGRPTMPPANSPNREPAPNREPTPTFVSALRGLESANEDVLNLAATLTTPALDDAAHLDAVGRYLEERSQQRLEHSREQLRQLERTRDDVDHDRLRRSMERLNRLHEASAAATATQYGERVPAQNTLFDWSPLSSTAREPDDDEERSLRALQARLTSTDSLRSTAILQAVRRHPRFSARTREYLRYGHDRESERETLRAAARPAAPRDTASLRRSTQDPWAAPRERYQASRNLPPQSQPPPPQPQPPPPPPPPAVAPMLEHTVKYLSRIRHANTLDESLNCALEAGFLSKDYFCIQYADFLTDTLSIPPPRETSWLAPGAVLSGCQHATTATATPPPASAQLPPPSRPWLSTSYSTPRSLASYLSPTAPRGPSDPSQQPPQQDRWPVKVTVHAVDWSAMSLSATMEAYNVPSHPHQHSLNNSNPAAAQYTRTSSITTYLEGEILDFNTHTLLTESFKSNAANDALYWRKLPPFRDMEDDHLVLALTSRRWWAALNREWVLMRWKERCFVKSLRPNSKPPSQSPAPGPPVDAFVGADTATGAVGQDEEREYYVYDSHTFARHAVPSAEIHPIAPPFVDAEHAAFDDSGCGLTISGFYYVCLRRSDGRVEGLYYDPMSSPYQCLKLESQGKGSFGSWDFA